MDKFKHSRLAYKNNAMIHETLNPVKTDIYPIQRRSCLTNGVQRGKIVPAVFNQAASRRKLLQPGRQAVSFAHRAKAVFFTLASPLHGLFPMVNRGKARLVAAATGWQFPTPCPLFATPNRRKFWAALNRPERGFTMQTQAARSGFLSWQQDTLPEIHDLIKQIKRAKGYQAARAAIVSAYEADSAAYGHIAAAIRAQIAIDRPATTAPKAPSPWPVFGLPESRTPGRRKALPSVSMFQAARTTARRRIPPPLPQNACRTAAKRRQLHSHQPTPQPPKSAQPAPKTAHCQAASLPIGKTVFPP